MTIWPVWSSISQELKEIRPDALIISDPGVFAIARRMLPEMEIHISTQANNTNYGTFLFWYSLGAKRVVTARELSLEEIREIRERHPGGHGDRELYPRSHVHFLLRAMPFKQLFCRDETPIRAPAPIPADGSMQWWRRRRPGEYLPVYENERGTFIFNSKDLCMIEHIPEMIEAGIDSFKIEGRMKTALYVATVARTYRKAIDDYLESPEKYRENMEWYKAEIGKCTYREFTTGFYFHKPDSDAQIYDSNTYVKNYTYIGTVEKVCGDGSFFMEQKNKFSVGESMEIMKPDGRNVPVSVEAICDEEGVQMESAPHPKQRLRVRLSVSPEPYDILRRSEHNEDEAGRTQAGE